MIIITETNMTRVDAVTARNRLVIVVEKIAIKSMTANPFIIKLKSTLTGITKPNTSGSAHIIMHAKAVSPLVGSGLTIF